MAITFSIILIVVLIHNSNFDRMEFNPSFIILTNYLSPAMTKIAGKAAGQNWSKKQQYSLYFQLFVSESPVKIGKAETEKPTDRKFKNCFLL